MLLYSKGARADHIFRLEESPEGTQGESVD
jgi:hypothetical protein